MCNDIVDAILEHDLVLIVELEDHHFVFFLIKQDSKTEAWRKIVWYFFSEMRIVIIVELGYLTLRRQSDDTDPIFTELITPNK